MSYILDALKQSERRRRVHLSSNGPSIPLEAHASGTRPLYRRRPGWLLLALVLALLAGYGLGQIGARWLGLSSSSGPVVSPEPRSVNDSPAATSEPPARQPIVIGSSTPPILVEEPPAVRLEEPPIPTRADTAHSPPAPEAARETPAPKPDFDPGVPDWRELPAGTRARLPDITLSVHIYSDEAADRMVNINGQMLREGQQISAGLRLKRITPQGIILSLGDDEFHMKSVGG